MASQAAGLGSQMSPRASRRSLPLDQLRPHWSIHGLQPLAVGSFGGNGCGLGGWARRDGRLQPGDVVWFPPGLKHWHDAAQLRQPHAGVGSPCRWCRMALKESVPWATPGQDRVERRLAAILAADVAGYSRLMGADGRARLGFSASIAAPFIPSWRATAGGSSTPPAFMRDRTFLRNLMDWQGQLWQGSAPASGRNPASGRGPRPGVRGRSGGPDRSPGRSWPRAPR